MRTVIIRHGDGHEYRVRVFDDVNDVDDWSWPTLAVDHRAHADDGWQLVGLVEDEATEETFTVPS